MASSFPDETTISIYPGLDHGKQHFNPTCSQEMIVRPARRVLHPKPSGDGSVWLGKKYIAPPISGSYKAAEAKHFPLELARSGYDLPERNLAGPSKKSVAWTNQGGRMASNARDYISMERSLDMEMGMKKRIPNEMKRRNGLLPQTRNLSVDCA